ncbi:hypothetical protein AB0F43_17135 [Kribbella sp. NPDC023972]|uniref:hypothetical protein n=1 Tax=Kribbella sp. NPDC023972 TaxID=3154795 RepID=UPI0033CCE373
MSKNVVLLSTRRLPPAYFDTVREDLGDPDVTLDVVGWVAPAGPVADKVNSFTLIGPGRMPVAPPPEPAAADPTEEAPDAVIAPEAVAEPEAVVAETEVPPAAAEVPADAAGEAAATSAAPAGEGAQAQATSTTPPAAAAKPRPTGAKRVVKAVQWRARKGKKIAGRMLPKAIKTSAPVKFLRGNRASKDLGKTYWGRILTRRDVMTTIGKADVVVALDAGAIWAGWNLGQRKASTPVVLGIPAARRELDMLKAPAGNG